MLIVWFSPLTLLLLVACTNLVGGQTVAIPPESIPPVQLGSGEKEYIQAFCSENERYTECSSSNCFEETCADLIVPIPQLKQCRKDCRSGCQCKPGYYRNLGGKCVSELTCLMCGQGEEWRQGPEKGCNGFTSRRIPKKGKKGKKDSTTNVWGCYCSNDTYRSKDGLCVSQETCKTCGSNEIFETCGSSSCWEYTCKDAKIPRLIRETRMCTEDCKQGCKCHPGFYRSRHGLCISAIACITDKKKTEKKKKDKGRSRP